METLTRVLARHVYSLDLSEAGPGSAGARGGRRAPAAPAPLPRPAPLHSCIAAVSAADARTPGDDISSSYQP